MRNKNHHNIVIAIIIINCNYRIIVVVIIRRTSCQYYHYRYYQIGRIARLSIFFFFFSQIFDRLIAPGSLFTLLYLSSLSLVCALVSTPSPPFFSSETEIHLTWSCPITTTSDHTHLSSRLWINCNWRPHKAKMIKKVE